MADISAFRGIRYRDDIALDDVVAPPYDVLSAAQAAELRARSPYNAVHVDLPVPPGAAADEEAYLRAAATFRDLARRGSAGARRAARHRRRRPDVHGAGRPASAPAAASSRGCASPTSTSGWSCRTSARTPVPRSTGCACTGRPHADVSQIFLLFPDDDGAVEREARRGRDGTSRGRAGATPATATATGTRPRRSPARRPRRVAEALRGRPVYIADGHHRYETALAYRDERRAAGDDSADTLMVLPLQPERSRAHRVPHAPPRARHPAALARRPWSSTCARSSRSSASR